MQTVPHLHFRGNCREAFRFYADTFGGRIPFAMTFGESPAAAQSPPELRDQIIHARLEFGDQAICGCDAPEERYQKPQGFNVLASVSDTEGGRAHLSRAQPRRRRPHALRPDLLGARFRHVHGSLRHPLDGQLREGELKGPGALGLRGTSPGGVIRAHGAHGCPPDDRCASGASRPRG